LPVKLPIDLGKPHHIGMQPAAEHRVRDRCGLGPRCHQALVELQDLRGQSLLVAQDRTQRTLFRR
jgi:hypothetical protein